MDIPNTDGQTGDINALVALENSYFQTEKKAAFARALNSPRQRQPFSSLARSELLDYPAAHRNKRGVRLE